ncbi:Pr6Pr family membrane protein [uncultured Brachyspira sp.]|uniref:Pr6Pr family membrane protein n=1 Tax=uncultured Brachyspira sp. TaxID=221953 RepID=UPI002618F65E|nr:Pr6Pr family membrane protein [uncultured Brachyspira sp.]
MKKIIYKLIIIILGLFAVISGLITADKKIDIETLYYFTYQSNILVIVYFIIDIIYLIKKQKIFMPRLKGTITMSITVTFLIYHFLLSGGYDNRADIIRSTILHYIVPIMTIVDYILFDKKGIYKNIDPILWLIIPLIYFLFIFIRAKLGGELSNGSYYPYFFIDINKYGIKTVLKNALFITIAFTILGYIELFIDRIILKLSKK